LVQDSGELLLSRAGRGFGVRGFDSSRQAIARRRTTRSIREIVKRAFSQRRKMMLKLLKKIGWRKSWNKRLLSYKFHHRFALKL